MELFFVLLVYRGHYDIKKGCNRLLLLCICFLLFYFFFVADVFACAEKDTMKMQDGKEEEGKDDNGICIAYRYTLICKQN